MKTFRHIILMEDGYIVSALHIESNRKVILNKFKILIVLIQWIGQKAFVKKFRTTISTNLIVISLTRKQVLTSLLIDLGSKISTSFVLMRSPLRVIVANSFQIVCCIAPCGDLLSFCRSSGDSKRTPDKLLSNRLIFLVCYVRSPSSCDGKSENITFRFDRHHGDIPTRKY